ncbi:MAG: MBL fold metallo-hydrolase [Cyanobacteria bacterium J06632_22]
MSHSATPVELPTSRPTQDQPIQWAVTFWGVRGHLPTPGLATAQYGGNTACLDICVGEQRLIFDGGTGLKALGDTLAGTASHASGTHDASSSANGANLPEASSKGEIAAHLFFTHARWDRIQGFPFFRPAFNAHSQLDIYGASAANGASIKQSLSTQMLHPNCPIPFYDLKAHLHFHNLFGGQTLTLGSHPDPVHIDTLMISSSSDAMGYRVRHQGRSIVYATEVSYPTLSPALVQWSRKADLLICNGGLLPKRGHSSTAQPTWQAAAEVAAAAQVKQTLLTSFSPDQTDQQLNDIEQKLKATTPNVRLAQEGLKICL